MGAQVIICPGARAAEAALLAEIERASSAARADASLLARPVRVVVPSRSLRDQLARALGAVLPAAAEAGTPGESAAKTPFAVLKSLKPGK